MNGQYLSYMKYLITENQKDKLVNVFNTLLNNLLDNMKDESEDWGLGEMSELEELNSVDHISVDRIVTFNGLKVYVDFHVNKEMDDWENVWSEIQYRINQHIPHAKIIINDIIMDDTEQTINESSNITYPIKSIEKILNTLGHDQIKKKYGFDLTFKIVDMKTIMNVPRIIVDFTGDLPYIFRNPNVGDDEWSKHRYDDRGDIEKVLSKLLKYVGINNGYVSMEYYPKTIGCSKMRWLSGVGTWVCLDNGLVKSSEDNKMLLSEVESDRWWRFIFDEDKKVLKNSFG